MRRAAPLLSVAIGMLLLAAAVGWFAVHSAVQNPGLLPLPPELAGLKLSMQMTGAEATKEFALMHREQFPLTAGAVGLYGDQQVGLWVAAAPLDFLAAGLVNAMHARIGEGDSPFTPTGQFRDGARVVYELEGTGQKHFYFQSRNLVIWLAAEPDIAEAAMRQTLEAYP